MNTNEIILILDFGSQYNQLIARRVREEKIYCRIVPHNITMDEVVKLSPRGMIFSGGPASVYMENAPVCDNGLWTLGMPILGICYGMQLVAKQLGGEVVRASSREYGKAELIVPDAQDIFKGLPKSSICWMSHGDHVSKLPNGFKTIARTSNSEIAAMADSSRRFYGLQFHPEVAHTSMGKEILKNFLYGICKCSGNWTMKSFLQESVDRIKEKVGRDKAVCGLSGGVDSSVAAVLVNKAIGHQLSCIFVNNGLLRKSEADEVRKTFWEHFHMDLHYVDAGDRFLSKLKGIEDPEEKRKIIGNEFIRVFEDEAGKLGGIKFLVQGTLYPDVIESTSAFGGPTSIIKTHHNVGGLPREMGLELIEPLRELFKDEVRVLGKELELPDEIILRQPFPGPGLAVRVIGEVTRERLNILREADERVLKIITKSGYYNKVWQSFAVLLPVKTVGVMGDERTYENVIALRAVTSSDGMTADWARLPYEVLEEISNSIINEVQGVNRVVFDISSKPPSTIEWE